MTDVSNLDDLANAISASGSPKIRQYAQAQAAATQSQELEIRSLDARVRALENGEPTDPPDPVPTPGYGSWLDTNRPRLARPVGSRVDVATLSELTAAIATQTWVRITQPITVGGDLRITRKGTAAAPLWIEGGRLAGARVYLEGAAYVGMSGVELPGGHDGVKAIAGSHHLEFERMRVSDTTYQGFLLGAAGDLVSDIQIWDTRVTGAGAHGEPDQHAIYANNVERLTVANFLAYDYDGYALHFYPNCRSAVATCFTVDQTTGAEGGPVVFASPGLDVQLRGGIMTRSKPGYEAIRVWEATASGSIVSDCVAHEVSSPSFPTSTVGGTSAGYSTVNNTTADPMFVNRDGRDYRLGFASPARDRCAARPEFVPAYDIDGKPRTTADAGAFAA